MRSKPEFNYYFLKNYKSRDSRESSGDKRASPDKSKKKRPSRDRTERKDCIRINFYLTFEWQVGYIGLSLIR